MDKVLFLDVDGVLNSGRYFSSMSRLGMDPEPVALLVDIIKQTGCKIVVSSSWRYGGIDEASDFAFWLRQTDKSDTVINAVIGATPVLNSGQRHDEIAAWIHNNDYYGDYVIVDDLNSMEELNDYFFRTDYSYGLTKEIAEKIIERLNNDI